MSTEPKILIFVALNYKACFVFYSPLPAVHTGKDAWRGKEQTKEPHE